MLVSDIQRNAQHWRLSDCTEAALTNMRHTLLAEMETLEGEIHRTNDQFLRYMDHGRPLETEQTRQSIDELAQRWQQHNQHLQEIDEAILERHLRHRLEQRLGSKLAADLLDFAVLVAILLIVLLTLSELIFTIPASTITWISHLDLVISTFLIADFLLRFSLAEDKGWYFKTYWIDLVASLPFSQFLRFGRLIRIARFARLLRLGRALRLVRYTFRGLDKLFQTFQLTLIKRSLLIATGLLFFGALSITILEGPQETSLQEMQQSLWWSFTTVVTGGFADLYNPSTVPGRLVTVGLVLLGLTITGIFTASLTSVLVEDDSARANQQQRQLEAQLEDVRRQLDLLSGETNQGLLALETVAQQLSNQQTAVHIATILVRAMLRDFGALSAAVYVLDEANGRLQQLHHAGDPKIAPPPNLPLGHDFVGRVVYELLYENNLAQLDIEPQTQPAFAFDGTIMVCPLVANLRVIGALHVILPPHKGRYYLYNRAPMTLAHHAALALHAATPQPTAAD
jgi:voltage-gated potassium channel